MKQPKHAAQQGGAGSQKMSRSDCPRSYRVVVSKDGYVAPDFMIGVLFDHFHMDADRSATALIALHEQGSAICGTYTRDIAETKVQIVSDYACDNQYPLVCRMEVEAD